MEIKHIDQVNDSLNVIQSVYKQVGDIVNKGDIICSFKNEEEICNIYSPLDGELIQLNISENCILVKGLTFATIEKNVTDLSEKDLIIEATKIISEQFKYNIWLK